MFNAVTTVCRYQLYTTARSSFFRVRSFAFSRSLASFSTKVSSNQQHLFDTIGILQPPWWHLSPAFGAAIQNSPFKNNMVRLADSVRQTSKIENESSAEEKENMKSSPLEISPLETPCKLMQCLYYQKHPGAPVQLTRSKSMAAAYLTPQIMGTLMGIALLSDKKYSEKEFRRLFKERHGIKSNYVEGEWTGVSLARWKEIVECLKSLRKQNIKGADSRTNNYDNLEKLLTTAVWSMAVWELTETRQCILDYLIALHEVSSEDVWNDNNQFVQRGIQTDSDVQMEWVSMKNERQVTDADDGSTLTQSSLEDLIQHFSAEQLSTSLDTARAIENLCTSILNRNHSINVKPTTPNGYYGFDGGDVKPDCVEVAVRELLDYMLWNDQEARFDISRLPSTAAPELLSLYETQSATRHGQEWFDMLSDIPGCLYLSSTPNGRPYELTPTLRNMAKVCRRLLYNDGSLSKLVGEDDDWESLSSLQDEWGPQDVTISFSTFSEKAKMSPDIIVHEVALVKRKGRANAIEMRLRCDWARNTGFATVTHMRVQDEKIDGELLDGLLGMTLEDDEVQPARLLTLPLSAGHGVLHGSSHGNLSSLVLSLLASRYGVDRREMLHITATSDLEREELAYRKAYRESEQVLKSSILKVCGRATDEQTNIDGRFELQLLNWILSENPSIDPSMDHLVSQPAFDKDIEQALLRLPNNVKFSDSFKTQAMGNWAIRSDIWGAVLDWRSEKKSLIDSIRALRIKDWLRFLVLNQRFQK